MPAFQNSPFLMALGWAIANSIWQSGLLWAVYQCTAGFNSKLSAKHKNGLSTGLVFISFVWFIYTLVVKLISVKPATELNYSQTDVFYQAPLAGGYDFQNLFSALKFSLPYFSVAYIILLCILFIKFFKAYKSSVFIRKYGIVPASAEWLDFTSKAAFKIRISRKVSIWFSTYINVPATVGFLKPIILIPLASINQLSTEQLEAIILHELAHIQRNDYLLNIIISVIETILFFNPFIVLLVKILKRERENCCDDLVIHYKYDRHSYASALVSIEKTRLNSYPLAMSATSGKNQLLSRVKRIVDNGKEINSFNYGQKLLTLLAITAIIISISWVYPNHQVNNTVTRTVAIASKTSPQKINNSRPKDSVQTSIESLQIKEPGQKKVISTIIKEIVSPVIENKTKKDEKDKPDLILEKQILTLDRLNALINSKHPDVEKGHNYDFSFKMDLTSVQNDINNINWNQLLPEQAFEYINPLVLDDEIKGLLEQTKKTSQLKKALIDKQRLLSNLSEQYQEQAIQFKNSFNEKAAFENFRKFKMDSAFFEGNLMNINLSEHPEMHLFKENAFERGEKRILREREIQQRYKTKAPSVGVKTKPSSKQIHSKSTQIPFTIDFNGKQMILDNDGIRVKKIGKTSVKNLKKVVLAFGDEVVHLNLDEE